MPRLPPCKTGHSICHTLCTTLAPSARLYNAAELQKPTGRCTVSVSTCLLHMMHARMAASNTRKYKAAGWVHMLPATRSARCGRPPAHVAIAAQCSQKRGRRCCLAIVCADMRMCAQQRAPGWVGHGAACGVQPPPLGSPACPTVRSSRVCRAVQCTVSKKFVVGTGSSHTSTNKSRLTGGCLSLCSIYCTHMCNASLCRMASAWSAGACTPGRRACLAQ
jgi:hypothetical protein